MTRDKTSAPILAYNCLRPNSGKLQRKIILVAQQIIGQVEDAQLLQLCGICWHYVPSACII